MRQPLWQRLHHWQQTKPALLALEDDNMQVTWAQLPSLIKTIADAFALCGGQAVGLQLENGCPWVVVDLALLSRGNPVIPLPSFFSQAQTSHVLNDAGLQWLVVDQLPHWLRPERIQQQWPLPLGLSLIQLVPTNSDTLTRQSSRLRRGVAKVTYTSGTTGQPKGVMLSATHQLRVARALAERLAPLGLQRHGCCLPLAVLLENVAGVYTALWQGATVILPALSSQGWQQSRLMDWTQYLETWVRFQPDSLIWLPAMLRHIVQQQNLSSRKDKLTECVRFIAVGGGKVTCTLLHQAQHQGLPVYEGYGLSECASVVALNTPFDNVPGSVGQLLPHLQAHCSAQGELVLQGNTFLGYLGQPRSAKRVVCTGDLVRLSQSNRLTVNGRCKNTIVTSYGRNINPEWVEAEAEAYPALQQFVLLGNEHMDLTALIFSTAFEGHILQSLASLNKSLPDYAQVGRWLRLAEPMTVDNGLLTSNGRLRRQVIQERFQTDKLMGLPRLANLT
ncbi:AMP-binding protein [Zooshikella harenae]|uniref:AMP-binding protein n=1 Tax=Zooshikella harenae TaxID=2827238 RepID=A0ABS5ZKM0_9GAMM|nr:AMP-binding protein [Zooshikella harenae]MBU2713562.1 AMP-binding protein [Zooshikella harenae]